MQILNKEANVREVCYFVSSNSKVCDANVENIRRFISVNEELSKDNKSVSNVEDLEVARKRVMANRLVRVKKLEEQQRAGYALISGLTLVGTLTVGAMIFMAIKFIVLG